MPYLRAFLFGLGVAVLVLISLSNTTPTYTPYQMAGVVLWHTFVGYCLGYHVERPTSPPVHFVDVPDVHPWSKPSGAKTTYVLTAMDWHTVKTVQVTRGVSKHDLALAEKCLRETCARRGHPRVLVEVTQEPKA